jgi:N-acetylglucosamine malate deacetylase 1
MDILVFAAHPDDEVLGVGGSIAKWVACGNKVDVKILAEGSTSRDLKRDSKLRENELLNLRHCAEKASDILGVNSLEMFGFPDNRMDSIDFLDIVKVIEEQVQKHKPQIIVTHHFGDLNIDHKIIHNAVLTAARPQPHSNVRRILTFETLSSTEWQSISTNTPFIPNWYEDISEYIDIKIKAINVYANELRKFPHSRSIESINSLSKIRGSNVGLTAAEAFMLIRNIEK